MTRTLALRAGTLLAASMLLWPGGARAETLTAACTGTNGNAASLTGTLKAANDLVGPDTIVLGAGCTYTLSAVDNSWYGPNGLPEVAGDVTVEGHGATIARSSAPGTPPFRLFFV